MKAASGKFLAYVILLFSIITFDIPLYAKTVWKPVQSREEVENASATDRFIIVAPYANRILCYSNQQYVEEISGTTEISSIPEDAFQFIAQKDDFDRLYFKSPTRNLYLTVTSSTGCIGTTQTTVPADFTDFPSLKLGTYYLSYQNGNFVRSSSKTTSAQIYKSYEKADPLSLVKFYLDDEQIEDGAVINDGVGKTLRVDVPEGCSIFYNDENDATENIMYNGSLTFTHPGTYTIIVRDEDEQSLTITIIVNGLFSENGLDFTSNLYGMSVLPAGEWQTNQNTSFSVTTDYGVDMFIPKGQNIALRQDTGQQYLEMEPGTCFNIAIQERRIVGIIIEGTGLENITFRKVPEMGNTVPTHEQIFSSMLYVDRQTSEETKAVWSAYEGTNITGLHIVNGRDENLTRSAEESARIYSIGLKFDIPTDIREIPSSIPIIEDGCTFYDLSGRQLPGLPTHKGIYIVHKSNNFSKILIH